MKICSRCKIEKEDSEFYWHSYKTLNGSRRKCLTSPCKKCRQPENSERYFNNLKANKNRYKKMLESGRNYKASNKEKSISYRRRYTHKIIKTLSDNYIVEQLSKAGYGCHEDIKKNKDLIEIKRIKILNKRIRKEISKLKQKI